ncbi:MAG: TonB family protein [Verrucomicrobiales bacterium]|nr:TonB family protein [Verrucomicrobiales bacterium]
MKPLQRECLTLSLIGHAALLAALFFGTAFLVAPLPPETESVTLLEFVPDRLVDAQGANPGGAAPPAQPPSTPPPRPPDPEPEPPREQPRTPREEPKPPPVERTPKPERQPEPERTPEPQRQPEPESEPPKPKYRTADQIEVNLNQTERQPDRTAQRQAEADRRRREQEAADARRALNDSVSRLRSQFDTQISFSVPGTGGASYMNYGDYVQQVYDRAWIEPTSGVDAAATVKTRVVIARDGKVLSATILERSGAAALDRSVQAVLDRVKNIGRPFPEGATDQQRSFIFNFNLKAKLGLGCHSSHDNNYRA